MRWRKAKAWSDQFVPQIQAILGQHLIGVADPEEDALRNTDLLTLQMDGGLRIACRIRRFEYLENYGDEFTLRCSLPSGRTSEIDKVLDGWGDYFFYGFANQQEDDLAAWLIGDLQVFRGWINTYCERHSRWPGELRCNHDGSSKFMVFGVEEIDPAFVVARQESLLQLA